MPPDVPTPGQLFRLARAQAQAVAALPAAMLSLSRAVGRLDGTLREARDAVAGLQRVADRLDGILDDIEQPLRDLAPGLRRVGKVLDDPVVDQVPETVRRIREDVLPLVSTLRGTATVFDRLSDSGRSLLAGLRPEPPAADAPSAARPAAPVRPLRPARTVPPVLEAGEDVGDGARGRTGEPT